MNSRQTVTLRDVALAADVSLASASVAISGRMGNSVLSAECIQRVRTVAARLGYKQNLLATALRQGRSQTIGLSVGAYGFSMVGHRFWGLIAAGAEITARQRGYDLLMVGGTKLNKPVQRGLHFLAGQRIDGLIIPQSLYSYIPPDLGNLPLVLLMGKPRSGISQVTFDDLPGIQEAVEHLSRLGHRHVVWIGKISRRERMYKRRAKVFLESCRLHQITGLILPLADGDYGVPMGPSVEGLLEALRPMALPADATAFMCMNDAVAMALFHLLQERDVRCPQDVSIIGFDDMYSDAAPRRLTTISHRLEDLGAAAVNLLISQIEAPPNEIKTKTESLPSKLVTGRTTGPALK